MIEAVIASPSQIRDEFENLIVRDILGPFGDADEMLPEFPVPRDRYLVGALAPRRVFVDPATYDAATSGTDADGGAEDRIPPPPMLPSSLGLSFVVASETKELRITASWGRYLKERVNAEEAEAQVGFDSVDASKLLTVWKRNNFRGDVLFRLEENAVERVELFPWRDRQHVRISARAKRRHNSWIVTLFLINDQEMPKERIDEAWLFQASLQVASADGAPIFVERRTALPDSITMPETHGEQQSLAMLYRNDADFAVGHGTAVEVERDSNDPLRAALLRTVTVPCYEVPRIEAPNPAEFPGLADAELRMEALAELSGERLVRALTPITTAYRAWIDVQRARIDDPVERLTQFRTVADQHLNDATRSAERIEAGIALLAHDPIAAEAFRFANAAMALQRRRQYEGIPAWRVFQLAFVLLNLPALTDPCHAERSSDNGVVDLLFFPTGGGKTEAYLGLAAYTFAIRRLQGTITTDDGELDGGDGVAVLMRYTLRLLTAQQFQRAAALVAACEILRRERVTRNPSWGTTPFRLGLYIGGKSTPNTTAEAHRAIETSKVRSGKTGGDADPLKLERCPWCLTELVLQRDVRADKERARTLLICSNEQEPCPFTNRRSNGEGIPVVTVDEEIYRLAPAFVIATVDKFAQLPWRGPMHTLFGRVSRRCERHGYRSPDLVKVGTSEERDTHVAVPARGLMAARTVKCARLRPPDLIIQDELHLISGPLGTLVGLYESAIDRLASYCINGVTVRPKVIASTATIRRAPQQVRAIFARDLRVFPSPGLDASDSFFARARPSEETPGRRYMGICGRGQRMKAIEARVAITVLAAAQSMYDRYGKRADPYMTLLAYFSSVRELAGMRRLLDDEVPSRLPKAAKRGLARRKIFEVRELTSRIRAEDILDVLARLAVPHDPDIPRDRGHYPLDVVLATNMISVGVDVQRLGLMVVTGQPKSTAEYIQATSRVGRDVAAPGLVLTLYNWTRPRDLSHYERFMHDHATFYGQVEPLSVTPFAPRALDRGLTAVLVGLTRHEHAHDALGAQTNANLHAQHAPIEDTAFTEPIRAYLEERAAFACADAHAGGRVGDMVALRFARWAERKQRQQRSGTPLSYDGRQIGTVDLLNDGLPNWGTFSAPNSLRDVERDINLLLDRVNASIADAPAYRPMGTTPQ